MEPTLIAFMLGISIMLGLMGLLFFIWGLRGGQFDDEKKMMQGVLFDDTKDLNSAANSEKKQKEAKEKDKNNTERDKRAP